MVRQGLIAWNIEILHILWPVNQLLYNTEDVAEKKKASYQSINIVILAQLFQILNTIMLNEACFASKGSFTQDRNGEKAVSH